MPRIRSVLAQDRDNYYYGVDELFRPVAPGDLWSCFAGDSSEIRALPSAKLRVCCGNVEITLKFPFMYFLFIQNKEPPITDHSCHRKLLV